MVCLFGTRKSKKILAEDRKGTFNECNRILEHILVDFVHNSGNEKLCRNRLWHICGFFSRICSGTLLDGEITWLKQSPLFYLICVLCAKFGGSYQLMFACVAFVTLYFIYAAIIRSSSDWVTSIYLYLCFCLYFQSFNQIRQMAAVAISLYALTWLQKDNIKNLFYGQ